MTKTPQIKAEPDGKGRYTLWLGNLTIIDHATQKPMLFSKMAMHGANYGQRNRAWYAMQELDPSLKHKVDRRV